MIVETTRFGQIEVDDSKLIRFPGGILGFPSYHDFALIQMGSNGVFYWLQAVDEPELAFVVCDPKTFILDYRAPVKQEDLEPIELEDAASAQVLIIVNKMDGMLTGNLQGPLVINVMNRLGKQMVLNDRAYGTRHPLIRVPRTGAQAVEKSA